MSDRKSAEDRANINAIYKPLAGYFSNAAKETKQAVGAVIKDIVDKDIAKNTPRKTNKGVVMGVKPKDNNAKAEFGQAVGAILKGKRYDNKGKSR